MLDKNNLHSYQVRAVNHIIQNRGCALFLDMGLGKTVSTLTAIEILHTAGRVAKVLVIAPKRVAESTWTDEQTKWSHLAGLRFAKILGTAEQRKEALSSEADIYLVNRENTQWLVDECGSEWPFDMVVIDELSSFKSQRSKRFKALRKVLGRVNRIVGLTGTPAPNSLMDLWAQIYLIDRGERLENTITRYRQIYFTPGKSKGHIVYEWLPRPYTQKAIEARLSDICLSMQAKEYLELPPIVYREVPIYLPTEVLAKYKEFEREKILELGNEPITASNAGVLANQLRQFASGALYNEVGSEEFTTIHNAKIDALTELADTSQSSILVGYEFRHDLERIRKALPEFRQLDTPRDMKEWNEGKIAVAGGHPASMGHGLNLQKGGNHIVWFSIPWSLELYQQFNARLYRQGQARPVVIHHLVAKGTIDERVMQVLRGKASVQQSILDTIKAIRDEVERGEAKD